MQLTFHFILFPHLVKSAGLCRCKVEMGKGNDGLEGKSRQHAASQIQGEGKKSDRPGTAGWLQAGMSYRCHSFDSYVVKRVAGEWWGRILQWYLSLSLILFMELARTGDTRRGKTARCLQLMGSEMTIANLLECSDQRVSHLCFLVILQSLSCNGMLVLIC